MKIAVIGAGAMGSVYGGHLSLHNEVCLIDKNRDLINAIRKQGLVVVENGQENTYYPKVSDSAHDIGTVDLILVFVKALFSKDALTENRQLIGPETYIMTLQNGAGHEELLAEFTDKEHIILGTTEDNGVVLEPGRVRRGGTGKTNLGMLVPDASGILETCKSVFDACGFECHIYDNIKQLIWDKLFTNVSLSAVTAVLQVPIGFIAANEYAWNMTKQLIHEAVMVAEAMGLHFDEHVITERVRRVSVLSPEGLTSIYMDVKNGRKTEVDTISGAVVKAAKKAGIVVPSHEMIVNMVHAMEAR